MNLLIVSDMSHYRANGGVVGWGPTVHEIDHLAEVFDHVTHIAFFRHGQVPASALPYKASNLSLKLLPSSGGRGFWAKAGVLASFPTYTAAIIRESRSVDVIHVRCPSSTGLLAVLYTAVSRRPRIRWVKYAGNWRPEKRGSLSYSLQRWLLAKGIHRGTVTINGEYPRQPSHVISFLNPCLDEDELKHGAKAAREKGEPRPARLVFIGSLDEFKGAHRAVEVLAHVVEEGIPARLDLIGDGPDREMAEQRAKKLGVEHEITFHGWVPRPQIGSFLSGAHFVVLPSESEGWPKVISEGMAFGAIPIAGAVGSVRHYLNRFGAGRALDPHDTRSMAAAVVEYIRNPPMWRTESARCVESAVFFSYSEYQANVQKLIGSHVSH